MKILIAADALTRKNLEKILEAEPNKKIVGFAQNGQETLAQAEQLQPDLILMELEIDGLAVTRIVALKHPKIKIILLSCSSSTIELAINAGAKGFIVRGTSQQDFLDAIDSVMKGSTVCLSQLYSRAENTTEQFSVTTHWNYLLAGEIVNFWLVNQTDRLDWVKALKVLGITLKSAPNFPKFPHNPEFEFDYIKFLEQGNSSHLDLFEELEKKLEYLFEALPVNLDSLKYIEKEIAKWYRNNKLTNSDNASGLILKNRTQIFKKDLNQKWQELVNCFWQEMSIETSLNFFKKIEFFLENCREQYEEKKEECLLKEKGCLKVYQSRLSAISRDETEPDWNYNLAKKALLNLYTLKLKYEIYSGAIQALEMILRTNQLYLDDLNNTQAFLSQIKEIFGAKTQKNIRAFLPLLFKQMTEEIDLAHFRQKIEQELGHSLPKWGTYQAISPEEVQHLLLQKLNPFTQKICFQLYEQLHQEFKQENWQNSTFNRVNPEIKAG